MTVFYGHQQNSIDSSFHCTWKMTNRNCAGIYNALVGLAGYLSSVSAGLSASLSSACAQKLNRLIPAFELNAWRYVAELFMSACLVVFTRRDVRISYIKVPWVILLGVLSVISNTAYYTAATYLPLGILELAKISISYIATLLLSKRLLHKQTVCFQYVAFIVILLGQLLLWQPCFLFPTTRCHNDFSVLNNATKISIEPQMEGTSWSSLIGYILVLVDALSSSLRTFIYRCQVPDISTSVVSLWASTVGVLLSLIVMIYFERPIIFLQNLDIWLLLGHATFAGCCGILLIHSQQSLHPLVFTILLNLRVVFGFVLQLVFPHIFIQSVQNIWEFVGIVLCLLGVVSYVMINFKIEKVSVIG